MELVHEQALLMDSKMAALQRENAEIRLALETGQTLHRQGGAMQDYCDAIDNELVDAYAKTEQADTQENIKALLVVISKKLMHQHLQRQLTGQPPRLHPSTAPVSVIYR